jgi:hypothetical protein
MTEKKQNDEAKSEERKQTPDYALSVSLPVTTKRTMEQQSLHLGDVNIEGCLQLIKTILLDRSHCFHKENDLTFCLETYVDMRILEKLGIKTFPVNLKINSELKQ